MISKIYRLPGRNIVSRSLITTQQTVTTNRFYSSYRDNDRNSNGSSSNSSNKDNDQSNQVPTAQQQQKQPTEQDAVVREQLSFMPVVNMPEAEFAHNAFFSLHRPLLGLSSDEERSFFTSTSTSRQHQHHGPNKIQKMLGLEQPKDEAAFNAEDEELTQYLMNLRPFEPPQSFDGKDSTISANNNMSTEEEDGTVVTLSFDDGHSAYDEIEAIHMDQSMPIFYMPDSDEVVDYLTAMQDKIQQRQQHEAEESTTIEQEENGRKRGSNRPIIHAATFAEARKRTMWIQQYRQRTRRQRSISMIERKQTK